jgi:hypothetical protein
VSAGSCGRTCRAAGVAVGGLHVGAASIAAVPPLHSLQCRHSCLLQVAWGELQS